jgi:tRNA (cytosine40_48-C5)-methyltransferase
MEQSANKIPSYLYELLSKQYNEADLKSIISGYSSNRLVCFRINSLIATKEEVLSELSLHSLVVKPVAWYEEGYVLTNGCENDLVKLECYQQGKIYIQNLSPMIPPLLFDYKPTDTILDMTAAPGGKTSEMGTVTNNKVSLTACERDFIRFERMKYNLNKQKVCCTCLNINALDLDDFFSFDKVLLDAPCSGSGTIEINKIGSNYKFNEYYLNVNIKRQAKLLAKAIHLLKKGGQLIYSTCSILSHENEEIIKPFLIKNQVQVEPINYSNYSELPLLPTLIKGALQICPTDLCEGFFVIKLTKK